MSRSGVSDPVRWLRDAHAGDLELVEQPLYRREGWVTAFLSCVDEVLAGSDLNPIRFDPTREALLVVGKTHDDVLRVASGSYRDVSLFHRALHPRVEALLAKAIDQAAQELYRQRLVGGEVLRHRGRQAILDDPSMLLDRAVVDGLRRLGLSGLPPVGVSGVIEVRSAGREYLLASLRSDMVAVNPRCLAPPVDGGIAVDGDGLDPRADLERELHHELPWGLTSDAWTQVGVVLPAIARPVSAGRAALQSGANVVFRATVKAEPIEVLRRSPDHFENAELVLIDISARGLADRLPTMLVLRDGVVAELEDPPALSEVLAVSLHDLDVLELTSPPDGATSASPSPGPGRASGRSEAPMSETFATPSQDISLEDAWAVQLTDLFPRLSSVLETVCVRDAGEARSLASEDGIEPMLDAVREYELVCRSNQLELFDEARLFEAVVIRVSRNLFANDERVALTYYDIVGSHSSLGATYQRRLDDALWITRSGPKALPRSSRVSVDVTAPGATVDVVDVVDPPPVAIARVDVSEAVAKRLDALNTDEAAMEYGEVRRRCQLLCFCAALWSVEAKKSTRAADVALDEQYRKVLAGDAMALFFRARALLVSPVASTAQTQLGLQFVTTALSYYPRNPGMHHTRANFLLRKSSTIVGEQESMDCLEQALDSVEEALKWDAEFPIFYATRAKVKYRQHNRSGALVDIRAAIELARYGTNSLAAQRDIRGWEALLESWDLAPVGAASGTG